MHANNGRPRFWWCEVVDFAGPYKRSLSLASNPGLTARISSVCGWVLFGLFFMFSNFYPLDLHTDELWCISKSTIKVWRKKSKQENGRTVRLCLLLWNAKLDVHFAHVNPWLFPIPITKPLLDFVHLLLKWRSKIEATQLSLGYLKIMN